MNDGHRDDSVGERKLIWDEENRLLSVDDNGLATPIFGCVRHRLSELDTLLSLARKVVSNYWYDADDERTVKTSGESDQAYVNGYSPEVLPTPRSSRSM